jgi:chorismate dehydratase
MVDPVRIGAVSYLNTRPLVHGLEAERESGAFDLSYAAPAELADRMVAGDLDLALLPAIELAGMPELEVVPGLGIVTFGASRSVLLVSNKPLDEVETVALDPESRTSNALARVLFAKVWHRQPAFRPGSRALTESLERCDAAVRIGDKALFDPIPGGCHVQDLGTVWTERTRLPFVFAIWAARPGVVTRDLYKRLHDSRRRGKASIERIARDYTWRGRAHPEVALAYLTRNIVYRLGSSEIDAMKVFFRTAAEIGVITEVPPIRLALTRWTACHATAAVLRGTQ